MPSDQIWSEGRIQRGGLRGLADTVCWGAEGTVCGSMSKGRVEEEGLILVTSRMGRGEKGDGDRDRHCFLSTFSSPKQEMCSERPRPSKVMLNKKVRNMSSRTDVARGRRPLKMTEERELQKVNRYRHELLRLGAEWSHSKQQNSSKSDDISPAIPEKERSVFPEKGGGQGSVVPTLRVGPRLRCSRGASEPRERRQHCQLPANAAGSVLRRIL